MFFSFLPTFTYQWLCSTLRDSMPNGKSLLYLIFLMFQLIIYSKMTMKKRVINQLISITSAFHGFNLGALILLFGQLLEQSMLSADLPLTIGILVWLYFQLHWYLLSLSDYLHTKHKNVGKNSGVLICIQFK